MSEDAAFIGGTAMVRRRVIINPRRRNYELLAELDFLNRMMSLTKGMTASSRGPLFSISEEGEVTYPGGACDFQKHENLTRLIPVTTTNQSNYKSKF